MPLTILATKLHVPPLRPERVELSRLIKRLNEGMHRRLTLVSAPAGFGKTTLVCSWLEQCAKEAAWLSLNEDDNNPARFLLYLIAALQKVVPGVGDQTAVLLKTMQLQPSEGMLTELINEVSESGKEFILVIDDYHVIDDTRVHRFLDFFLHHGPRGAHVAIATREDPPLPLAGMRARAELNEIRASDLRFSHEETGDFLRRVMGISIDEKEITELERRTEGWIACLQMAAISMRDQEDIPGFIESFSGSHRYVMDYLGEEVLNRQPEEVQSFLLCTSILERFCGPLCDALLLLKPGTGREFLSYLERSNLFIVPLDNEREWYRYHHLFAELLRHRLKRRIQKELLETRLSDLHIRAGVWYEQNGFELEAFKHFVTAGDVERAARLAAGGGMPLHFRGAVIPVVRWLERLSKKEMDRRPELWVMYASALSMKGELAAVEEKLKAAEAAMEAGYGELNKEGNRNIIGHIAAIRALIAATHYRPDEIIAQSALALEFLHKDNLPVRTATVWKMGWAYHLQGDRKGARHRYDEAIAISEKTGNSIISISARSALGVLEEEDTRLKEAADIYRSVIREAGDSGQPFLSEVNLGLGRIYYQWNNLKAAEEEGEKSLRLGRISTSFPDRYAIALIFLARVKLARKEMTGASSLVKEAEEIIHRNKYHHLLELLAEIQVLLFLCRGKLESAEKLTDSLDIPISMARVYLARAKFEDAKRILETHYQQAVEREWPDEVLKTMVLMGIAYDMGGERGRAADITADALALAEPGGYIRIFLDEGDRMAGLVSEAGVRSNRTHYVQKVRSAFETERSEGDFEHVPANQNQGSNSLTEPLSPREKEVLALLAEGLSNREICDRLFLALDTVKGHNRRIFGKLNVKRRTEAVARARKLGLYKNNT